MRNFKKGAAISVLALFLLVGAGCSNQKTLTEEQQATEKGMTLEEYRDTKEAAARMNMTVDEHMKMNEDEMEMHQ